MHHGEPVDWFHVFRERFWWMSSLTDKSKALGCTFIIRRLAWYERVDIECEHDDYIEITLSRLVGMQLYNSKAKGWNHKPVLLQRNSRKGKEPLKFP